jgi:hypothetical protein
MKSYKQFIRESKNNHQIIDSTNESYFELVDILQSKIFDDFDIIPATDEDLENLNNIRYKFWIYGTSDGELVYPKDIGDRNIDDIYVHNINEEHINFLKSLKSLKNIVKDITGKKLSIEEDMFYYPNGYNEDGDRILIPVYDYIIKLK